METRLIIFLSGLIVFTLVGFFKPFISQKLEMKYFSRMGVNILFGSLGAVLTSVVVPGGLYYIGMIVGEHQFGLFNHFIIPHFLEFLITLVFLDMAIYAQHVLTHHWPLLWRFHKVHHGDKFLDTTTALRFHPGEILISFFYKGVLVVLFGLDPLAVLAFEVLLNFSAMFNHANFSLPAPVEKLIRPIIVTPDFHRVHHSPIRSSTDTNYGFFFSFWDTLFNTLNTQHTNNEKFGLKKASYSGSNNFLKLLVAPFIKNEHQGN